MQKKKEVTMEKDGKGIYLYCLARPGSEWSADIPGPDGDSGFLMHEHSGAAAAISRVPLEKYSGLSAEQPPEDLSWLLAEIIRHEKVIQKVMSCSPVIPVRFATIFSSIEKIEELVRINQDTIHDFFTRTQGMSEWAVKGILDRKLAREAVYSALLEREKTRISSLPPGRQHFEKKRIKLEADSETREWIRQTLSSVCRDLQGHASGFAQRSTLVQERAVEGEAIFNWAFLVSRDSLDDFQRQVNLSGDSCVSRGLTIEASGPWPPYSFAPALKSGTWDKQP